MRCPWCGSPVMIHGNRWECGYCGDFGNLAPAQPCEEVDTTNYTLSISFTTEWENSIDFPDVWNKLQSYLRDSIERDADRVFPLLPNVFLYTATCAAKKAHDSLSDSIIDQILAFTSSCAEFSELQNIQELSNVLRNGIVLYADQAMLTEQHCGTFWAHLIELIPNGDLSEDIDSFVFMLGQVYDFILGDDVDIEDCYDPNLMREYLERHSDRYWYFHPDTEKSIERLLQDDTSYFDEDCRDILIPHYSSLMEPYNPDSYNDFYLDDFLQDLYETDSDQAFRVWNTLEDEILVSPTTCPSVYEKLKDACPFSEDVFNYWCKLN